MSIGEMIADRGGVRAKVAKGRIVPFAKPRPRAAISATAPFAHQCWNFRFGSNYPFAEPSSEACFLREADGRRRRRADIANRWWTSRGSSVQCSRARKKSAMTRRTYLCSDLVGDRPATIGIGAKVVGHVRCVAFQMAGSRFQSTCSPMFNDL